MPATPEPVKTMQVVPVKQEEPVSLLAIIGQAALNPAVDVEKMRALLELRERIDENDAKKLFHAEMIAAQDEIKPVVRDRMNTHTNSKYAQLEKIDRAIRPIYTKHGFVLSFNSRTEDNGMLTMICDCMHRGGYSKQYQLTGALDLAGPGGKQNKTGIQAAGSSTSYLRRYLTSMIFNVILTDEDDDGNGSAETIGLAQVNKIRDLLIACDMADAKSKPFLDFMGVAEVEHIPVYDYERAVTQLNAKLKRIREGK